jgi:hypothetical protein
LSVCAVERKQNLDHLTFFRKRKKRRLELHIELRVLVTSACNQLHRDKDTRAAMPAAIQLADWSVVPLSADVAWPGVVEAAELDAP